MHFIKDTYYSILVHLLVLFLVSTAEAVMFPIGPCVLLSVLAVSTQNVCRASINPLEFRGNYSATSNNMKFVHWPLMGGLLHLVQ